MADKKRTSLNNGPDLLGSEDPFTFSDLDGSDNSKLNSALKKRKPITKLALNVGKGSLSHFSSESFIRNTLARSLPRGYSTAVDSSYGIKRGITQLYNSAAEEYRRIKPEMQRAVKRVMPTANKMLPKRLQERLNRFSEGPAASSPAYNPDEEALRSVLGELEQTREKERVREYTERDIKEDLKNEINAKRFTANIQVLASIDARLGRMQAFNDQIVSRYQKRTLEVLYRQYFTQRDTLKLLGTELSQSREALAAILHNTSLPDIDKMNMRDQFKKSIKAKLGSFAPLLIGGAGGMLGKGLMETLTSRIKGGASGASSALSGMHMAMDASEMSRSMGIDPKATMYQGIGGALTGAVLKWILERGGRGFGPAGFVAQKGAHAAHIVKDLPMTLQKYASSATKREGLLGSVESFIKGLLPLASKQMRVGGSFVLSAGERGEFTKKTQRSIETIIPGFLSKIHHELAMMRTGNAKLEPVVWNDEKEDFSTQKQLTGDIGKRIFGGQSSKYAVQSARDAANFMLAGSKVSDAAHTALTKEIMHRAVTNQPMDALSLLKPGQSQFITSAHARELRKATNKRYINPSTGKQDRVLLGQLNDKLYNVRSNTPNIGAMSEAYQDLGNVESLRGLGLLKEEGDNRFLKSDVWVNHLMNHEEPNAATTEYQRGDYGNYGRKRSYTPAQRSSFEDLIKPGMPDQIVVYGSAVSAGNYTNLKTGEPTRIMADVLDGLQQHGRIIVTAEQAKKLVTRAGNIPLPEYVAKINASKYGQKGILSKVLHAHRTAGDYVEQHLGAHAAKLDEILGARAARYRGKKGRQRAKEDAATAVHGVAPAPAAIYNAQAEKVSALYANRGETLASLKMELRPAQLRARKARAVEKLVATKAFQAVAERVKKGWAHALPVRQFATNFYLNSIEKPVIEAKKLIAGKYISATTSKPITDLRDVVDGVKDAVTKEWVVSATEAIDSLKTNAGDTFSTYVDNAETAVKKAAAGAAATAAAATPSFLGSIWAKVTGRSEASSTAAGQGPRTETPTTPSMDAMTKLVASFKEENAAGLASILDVLMHSSFGGGTGAAGPSVAARGRGVLNGILARLKRTPGHLWSATKTLGGMYKNYVTTAFKLPLKIAGGLGSAAAAAIRTPFHLGKEPADVYIKGERMPALERNKMIAGDYFNMKPDGSLGKPIKVPKDIGGPVKDKNGSVPITLEDFKKGLTDQQGRSFALKALSGLWSTTKAVAGFYGSMVSAPIKAIAGVGKLIGKIINYAKFPQDVYVQGDSPWIPRMTARGMLAGSYVLKDKPRVHVRTVQAITGEVMDISKTPVRQVIFAEDFTPPKGLVDIHHKPFQLKQGIVTKLGHALVSAAGSLGSGYIHLLGAMGKAGGHLAAMPFKLASKLFGGFGGGKTPFAKHGMATADAVTHSLLAHILTIVKDRMPIPKKTRLHSYKDELLAQKEMLKEHEKKYSTTLKGKLHLGGMFGKLKGGLHKGKDMLSHLKDLKDMKKLKGLWGKLKEAKSLFKDGGKLRKVFGLLKDAGKIGGAGVAGDALGVGGAAAEGGAVVGGDALAATAVTAGAAEGGGLLAGALGVGGTILSGAAVVGGALLSGLLTVISSPVVLVGAAIAAVGYGAYKLYSNHELREQKLRSLRMAQYGVDVNRNLSDSKEVAQLEALFEPHTTVTNGKAEINSSQIKKTDVVKILKMFGFSRSKWNPLNWFHHTTPQDILNKQALVKWVDSRFKTVFLNWIGATREEDPSLSISKVDSHLKPIQKRALLKKVMSIDKSIYNEKFSPFDGDPLTAGPREVQAAYESALKSLGNKGLEKPVDKTAKGAAVVAKTGAAAAAVTGWHTGASKASGGDLQAAMRAPGLASVGSKATLTASTNLSRTMALLGGKIHALTAIRYKTYGLTDMNVLKVRALFMLEQDVFSKLIVSSGGKVTFDGNVTYFFDRYAGYFGISPSDAKEKLAWYSWFSKRFIPTILQFTTAVKHANKTTDPRDADRYLNPIHQLEVATLTVAATYHEGSVSASVWSFTQDTPFGDHKSLNGDSHTTAPNIQALKNKAAKEKMEQVQAAAPKTAAAKPVGSPAQKTFQAIAAQQKLKQKPLKAPQLPAGLDPGSVAAKSFIARGGKPSAAVGMTVPQPGHGTAGDINSIPMPHGVGYAAVRTTLDAAAKMVGIDPTVLSTFAGIESSWNPNAAAGTSSAKGLGQFINATWRSMLAQYASKFGINPQTSPFDPRANALMLGEYIKSNQRYLTGVLHRNPTDTELYMAHFLGPGGAGKILAAPGNTPAAALDPSAAAANIPIFYRDNTALTKNQMVSLLNRKVSHYRSEVLKGNTELAGTSSPKAPGGAVSTWKGPVNAAGGAPESSPMLAALHSSKPSSGISSNITMPLGGASLTSTARAPDLLSKQNDLHYQKAAIVDKQARLTADAQTQHLSGIHGTMKQQTLILGKIASLLTSIDTNTGHLPALAGASSGLSPLSRAGSKVVASVTPETPPSNGRGGIAAVPLAPPVVGVNAPVYG